MPGYARARVRALRCEVPFAVFRAVPSVSFRLSGGVRARPTGGV